MSNVPSEIEAEADDLIEGVDPLTPLEEVFAAAFANVESVTYGNATASARVAGYKSPENAAWRLRRRPRVMAKIAAHQKGTIATIGKVFSDLENQRLLAIAKGDIQAANRSSELQGKHLAMFTDRVLVDEVVRHEYDAKIAAEVCHLARQRLENAGPAGLGVPPDVEGKLVPGQESGA